MQEIGLIEAQQRREPVGACQILAEESQNLLNRAQFAIVGHQLEPQTGAAALMQEVGQGEGHAAQVIIQPRAKGVPEDGLRGPALGYMGANGGFADARRAAYRDRSGCQQICGHLLQQVRAAG